MRRGPPSPLLRLLPATLPLPPVRKSKHKLPSIPEPTIHSKRRRIKVIMIGTSSGCSGGVLTKLEPVLVV